MLSFSFWFISFSWMIAMLLTFLLKLFTLLITFHICFSFFAFCFIFSLWLFFNLWQLDRFLLNWLLIWLNILIAFFTMRLLFLASLAAPFAPFFAWRTVRIGWLTLLFLLLFLHLYFKQPALNIDSNISSFWVCAFANHCCESLIKVFSLQLAFPSLTRLFRSNILHFCMRHASRSSWRCPWLWFYDLADLSSRF